MIEIKPPLWVAPPNAACWNCRWKDSEEYTYGSPDIFCKNGNRVTLDGAPPPIIMPKGDRCEWYERNVTIKGAVGEVGFGDFMRNLSVYGYKTVTSGSSHDDSVMATASGIAMLQEACQRQIRRALDLSVPQMFKVPRSWL